MTINGHILIGGAMSHIDALRKAYMQQQSFAFTVNTALQHHDVLNLFTTGVVS